MLGFSMMARRSELAALDIADVDFTRDGMEVTVRVSKTDQDAVGEIVPIPYGTHPDTCPVRTVENWLLRLSRRYGIDTGPLLRSVTRHGDLGFRMGSS